MPIRTQATFYHAGCPVCVDAERNLAGSLDPARISVDFVHLGETRNRLDEARRAGVKSVPALVMDGAVYHINFGASLDALA